MINYDFSSVFVLRLVTPFPVTVFTVHLSQEFGKYILFLLKIGMPWLDVKMILPDNSKRSPLWLSNSQNYGEWEI